MSFVASTAGEEIFGWAIFLLFLFVIAYDLFKSGFKNTIQNLKLGGADFPVLFFGAWALLATWIIFKSTAEVKMTLSNVRWIFLLYGFSYLLKKYFTLNISKYFKFVFISAALVGIYGIVQMFTRIDLWRVDNSHMSQIGSYYRATGFYTVPLTYAYCIGMVGIFAFAALLLQTKEKKNFLLPVITTVATIGAIIASSTRGAWIAYFVAVMIITYLMDRKKAAIVFLVSILVAGPMMFEPTIQKRAMSIFDMKTQASNTERINLWIANFEMFKDHPLLGVGLEKSRSRLGEYYQKLEIKNGYDGHAHNDFMNTLSGVGLPGIIAWVWFCAYFVFLSYKVFRNSKHCKIALIGLGALGSQIYFFVGGLTQCNFSDNEVNHILIFVWAMLVAIQHQTSKKILN